MEWKLETKTYRSRSAPLRNFLTLISGKTSFGPIEVHNEIIELGCDKEDNLVVGKEKISHYPIRLETKDGKTHYTSLSKSSATKINGTSVSTCWLRHGDKLQIGNNVMIFNSARRDKPRELNPNTKLSNSANANLRIIKLNTRETLKSVIDETNKGYSKTSLSILEKEGSNKPGNRFFQNGRRSAFLWTFGLSLFAAILFSLVVLWGKELFSRNPAPQATLEKISLEIMKEAALGNFYEAALILKTAHKLFGLDTSEKTQLQSLASFLMQAKKVRHSDHLADSGAIKQALLMLEELKPSSLHQNDQENLRMAISLRKERWGPLVISNNLDTKRSNFPANTQIQSLWIQAIGIFKSGEHIKSCNMVKQIVDDANPQTIWWKKAQSFFERKCSA